MTATFPLARKMISPELSFLSVLIWQFQTMRTTNTWILAGQQYASNCPNESLTLPLCLSIPFWIRGLTCRYARNNSNCKSIWKTVLKKIPCSMNYDRHNPQIWSSRSFLKGGAKHPTHNPFTKRNMLSLPIVLDFYTLTNLVPVLATSSSCSVPRIANLISVKLCLINRGNSLTLLLYSFLGNFGPTNCPSLR